MSRLKVRTLGNTILKWGTYWHISLRLVPLIAIYSTSRFLLDVHMHASLLDGRLVYLIGFTCIFVFAVATIDYIINK